MISVKEVELFPHGNEVGNVGAADAGRQGWHGIGTRDGERSEKREGEVYRDKTDVSVWVIKVYIYVRSVCLTQGKNPQNGKKTPR